MSATLWPRPDALGFTVADLHALPDDSSLRYELIDGSIVVSPSAILTRRRA